jgi:hypothetical protein
MEMISNRYSLASVKISQKFLSGGIRAMGNQPSGKGNREGIYVEWIRLDDGVFLVPDIDG